MPTRADIVNLALAENGYHDGQGYDERCRYTQFFLGAGYGAYGEGGTGPNDTPVIAYCDIFVSYIYAKAGLPLPNMGGMISEGQQYCPSSWAYAQSRGATRASYLAQPGDQTIFDWTGTGVLGGESHTEIVERWSGGVLYTVGGNSGPSNVDGFKGVGGVHRHAWSCPAGVGNPLIMGVIDTSKLVNFSTTPTPTPAKDDPVTTILSKLPLIDPGLDRGHPRMVKLIDTLLTLENPKIDLSTPAKKSMAVKQIQAVFFNGWLLPPHGPSPSAVTGKVDAQTLAALNYAAGVQQ